MQTLLDRKKKLTVCRKIYPLLETRVREQESSAIFCVIQDAISDAFHVDVEALKMF
jgi:hypothetical protein